MAKVGKNIKMLVLIICLILSASVSVEAKTVDVTWKYRTKVTSMLNELDGYLCFDIAFPNEAKNSRKFVFNDYAKTSMICYRRLWKIQNMSVSQAKKKYEKDLKLFFGDSAKFKLKKYYAKKPATEMQYMMQNKNGKVVYLHGEYGEIFPCGKVSKIQRISSRKYVVTYKEYLRYLTREGSKYRGTYQINLKPAKNRYGFIITNIKRTSISKK